ncbi:cytochrome P450 [Streptomyces pseudovenezuelae]|uniref:cytochrome P450 n=1 Tax=Streptomyces pseudovenezuelae TaxID=67350 RepID=UPI002E328EFC|nr:cytochrome P450 [Streptomyces pseudovenezuelae]
MTMPADTSPGEFSRAWSPFQPEEIANPRRSWQRLSQEPPTWNPQIWPLCPGAEPNSEVLLLTRQQDLADLYQLDRSAMSLTSYLIPPQPQPPAERADEFPHGWWWGGPLIFGTNPWDRRPVHTVVARGLTGAAFNSRSQRFRATATELVKAVRERGEMEIVRDFSTPYVGRVLGCDLAGLPVEQADLAVQTCAYDQVNLFLHSLGLRPMSDTEYGELVDRQAAYGRYLVELLEQRQADPQDDAVSDIAQGFAAGEITLPEAVSAIYHLYAAFDQPKLMIGNVVHHLLERPERWSELVADRSLLPAAVEECFRMLNTQPLLQTRVALEDVEIGGVPVRKGQMVCPHAGAANRDAEAFEDPDAYYPGRPDARKSMTFSRGAHGCLGTKVARAYLLAALDVMMDALPGLRLASDEAPTFALGLFSGVEKLDLRWDV